MEYTAKCEQFTDCDHQLNDSEPTVLGYTAAKLNRYDVFKKLYKCFNRFLINVKLT